MPRESKRRAKPVRELTEWNKAMQKATRQLRAANPGLHGKELFVKGAKLAHQILGR